MLTFSAVFYKMKFLVLCATVLAMAAAHDRPMKTLDDHFDFTKLNHEQLTAVAMCFMNKGPCNDVISSYKKYYPGIVVDACARCNDAQKEIARVYYSRIIKELPDVYLAIRKHMDPKDKYFDGFLANIGYKR